MHRPKSMSSPDRLSRGEKRKLTGLKNDLLEWSKLHGRSFPWRDDAAGEYQKIAVEVLLQRTRAGVVSGFYEAFFVAFPTWASLANADHGDLETFLRPLGLWRRRAASLIALARYAAPRDGKFPSDPEQHAEIPAVGQYVSNAMMVFQHGKEKPLLDVNMARVVERFLRPRRLADIRFDPWLQQAAHWLVRGPGCQDINWAVLDFAALVCKARNPGCLDCPVHSRCNYYLHQKSKKIGQRKTAR